MSNFEILDRRGLNKPSEETKPVQPATKDAIGKWKSVDYVLALAPLQDGSSLIMGRCVGKRGDGQPFVADYWFTAQWKHNKGWEEVAKNRLDSFLNCRCTSSGPCNSHKILIPEWMKADKRRMELAATEPVSEAVEAVVRAEAARRAAQPNILVPKG